MTLYAEETAVNLDRGYRFGESGVYETNCETHGELFRAMRKEYGRCVGRVHVYREGKTLDVGWIFLKRDRYDDSRETFLRETWVTVHKAPPTRPPLEFHYAPITSEARS